eukprot:jgi/Bigna1/72533/fgenesh1_pg.20_\
MSSSEIRRFDRFFINISVGPLPMAADEGINKLSKQTFMLISKLDAVAQKPKGKNKLVTDPLYYAFLTPQNMKSCISLVKELKLDPVYEDFFIKLNNRVLKSYGTSLKKYVAITQSNPIDFGTILNKLCKNHKKLRMQDLPEDITAQRIAEESLAKSGPYGRLVRNFIHELTKLAITAANVLMDKMIPKLRTKCVDLIKLKLYLFDERPLRELEAENGSKVLPKRCDICQMFGHAKCLVEKDGRLRCSKCLRPKRHRKDRGHRSKRGRKTASSRQTKRIRTESSGKKESFEMKKEGHTILDDMDKVIRNVERLDKYEHSLQSDKLEHENWRLRNELAKYTRVPYYAQPMRAHSSMPIIHRSRRVGPTRYVEAVYPGYERERDVHSNYIPPHDNSIIGTAVCAVPKEVKVLHDSTDSLT